MAVALRKPPKSNNLRMTLSLLIFCIDVSMRMCWTVSGSGILYNLTSSKPNSQSSGSKPMDLLRELLSKTMLQINLSLKPLLEKEHPLKAYREDQQPLPPINP